MTPQGSGSAKDKTERRRIGRGPKFSPARSTQNAEFSKAAEEKRQNQTEREEERERWIERISREGICNDVRVQEAGAERGEGESDL